MGPASFALRFADAFGPGNGPLWLSQACCARQSTEQKSLPQTIHSLDLRWILIPHCGHLHTFMVVTMYELITFVAAHIACGVFTMTLTPRLIAFVTASMRNCPKVIMLVYRVLTERCWTLDALIASVIIVHVMLPASSNLFCLVTSITTSS